MNLFQIRHDKAGIQKICIDFLWESFVADMGRSIYYNGQLRYDIHKLISIIDQLHTKRTSNPQNIFSKQSTSMLLSINKLGKYNYKQPRKSVTVKKGKKMKFSVN